MACHDALPPALLSFHWIRPIRFVSSGYKRRGEGNYHIMRMVNIVGIIDGQLIGLKDSDEYGN